MTPTDTHDDNFDKWLADAPRQLTHEQQRRLADLILSRSPGYVDLTGPLTINGEQIRPPLPTISSAAAGGAVPGTVYADASGNLYRVEKKTA